MSIFLLFWLVIAIFYFALAIFTGIARYKLKQDLSTLDERSPTGNPARRKGNEELKIVPVESTLYNALKAMLITEIIGFVLAGAAATSLILTD